MTTTNLNNYKASSSLFITLEGIEGAGKTTQIEMLKEYFEKGGYQVLTLREPGGTAFGEALRAAILKSQSPINPISEAYLFASSRAQLLTEKIIPFLQKEKHVVICDRYLDSSLAYQGVAAGLGIDTILKIHSHFPLTIRPDITFYVKISLETSFLRQQLRNQEKDYFESKAKLFYEKLIQGYNEAAVIFPDRINTIDGENSISEISNEILSKLDRRQ